MLHDILLRGDPKNLNDSPGVIAEQRRMGQEQARTNEILTELRGDLRRINWMILAGFITALLSTVWKGVSGN